MKNNESPFIRILELILAGVIGFVIIVVGTVPEGLLELDSSSFWGFTADYLGFIGIWIAFFICMLIFKNDRPIMKALSHKVPGNNVKNFLFGLFVYGFGFNGLSILLAWVHKDISLAYSSFEILPFMLLLVSVFIQSSAEELVCRVFLYQKARKLFPDKPWIAVIFNSLFFAFLHLFNSGVTVLAIVNITAVGLFYSIIVYYTNSVWCTMAAHAGWNFTQNILFGLPNSGRASAYSVFTLDTGSAKDSIFYNVGFGVEGTVFVCSLLIIASVILILLRRKRERKEYNVWAEN